MFSNSQLLINKFQVQFYWTRITVFIKLNKTGWDRNVDFFPYSKQYDCQT